jgi:acyl-ACP thioesterase
VTGGVWGGPHLRLNTYSRVRIAGGTPATRERTGALCLTDLSGILGIMDVGEEKFVVRTFDCGVDGKLKIASLMQYLQEAAALHAQQLGFGFERLSELGTYWVLSNIRVEVVGLPRWNKQVTVQTWPSGYSRLIATREFVARASNGDELFKASSEWMVFDKQRARPKNLFHLDLGLPKTAPKVLDANLHRLEPRDDYRPAGHVLVPSSSIDLNGHVNNTEYVRWGTDALSRASELEGNIRSVQATYLSEVFEVLVSNSPPGFFNVLARKSATQTNVYLMEVSC